MAAGRLAPDGTRWIPHTWGDPLRDSNQNVITQRGYVNPDQLASEYSRTGLGGYYEPPPLPGTTGYGEPQVETPTYAPPIGGIGIPPASMADPYAYTFSPFYGVRGSGSTGGWASRAFIDSLPQYSPSPSYMFGTGSPSSQVGTPSYLAAGSQPGSSFTNSLFQYSQSPSYMFGAGSPAMSQYGPYQYPLPLDPSGYANSLSQYSPSAQYMFGTGSPLGSYDQYSDPFSASLTNYSPSADYMFGTGQPAQPPPAGELMGGLSWEEPSGFGPEGSGIPIEPDPITGEIPVPGGFGSLVAPPGLPSVPSGGVGASAAPPPFYDPSAPGSGGIAGSATTQNQLLNSLAQGPVARLPSRGIGAGGRGLVFDPASGGYVYSGHSATGVYAPPGGVFSTPGAGPQFSSAYGPAVGMAAYGAVPYMHGGVDPSSGSGPGPLERIYSLGEAGGRTDNPGWMARHPSVDSAALSPDQIAALLATVSGGHRQPYQIMSTPSSTVVPLGLYSSSRGSPSSGSQRGTR